MPPPIPVPTVTYTSLDLFFVGVVLQRNLHLEDAREIFDGIPASPLGKEVNVSKTASERIDRPGRSNANAAELYACGCGNGTQHFRH